MWTGECSSWVNNSTNHIISLKGQQYKADIANKELSLCVGVFADAQLQVSVSETSGIRTGPFNEAES